jgi:DNA mismatch repair protein MLH3
MILHNSEVIARNIPCPSHQRIVASGHGTRIILRDLFGNMPVRVKHRANTLASTGSNKDFEALVRGIVGLLLPWNRHIQVNICDVVSGQKVQLRSRPSKPESVDIDNMCILLNHANFMSTTKRSSWVPAAASTSKVRISGAICLDPAPSRNVQFLSLEIRSLAADGGHNIFYEYINRLFKNSAFGLLEEAIDSNEHEKERRGVDQRYSSSGYTNRELKGGRKGVDRWPMFYLNIEILNHDTGCPLNEEVFHNSESVLASVMELLEAMVTGFLTQYHFRPRNNQRHRLGDSTSEETTLRHWLENDATQDDSNKLSSAAAQHESGSPFRFDENKEKQNITGSRKGDITGRDLKFSSHVNHSVPIDSPFDSWSRIKSGRPLTKYKPHTDVDISLPCHKRPASASSNPEMSATTGKSALSFMGNHNIGSVLSHINSNGASGARDLPKGVSDVRCMIDRSGRIISKPFADYAPAQTPHPETASEDMTLTPRETATIENAELESREDELVSWLNPITKNRSLVNCRTGLVVREKNPDTASSSFMTHDNLTAAIKRRRLNTKSSASGEPEGWVRDVLKNWNNPVYQPTEVPIPQLSLEGSASHVQNPVPGQIQQCSHTNTGLGSNDLSLASNRLSKQGLQDAEVIAQIDRKFILVKMSTRSVTASAIEPQNSSNEVLVIIDQHAADERCRIEELFSELCLAPTIEDCVPGPATAKVRTVLLSQPIIFEVSVKEHELLKQQRQHFANWGIIYDLTAPAGDRVTQQVSVHRLPPCIGERCRQEPRLLIDLMRTEIWSRTTQHSAESSYSIEDVCTGMNTSPPWVRRINDCPRGVLDMLNSRACRSAIMFNDVLTKHQCELLLRRLAACAFPFQCAHGRPSVVPLVDMQHLSGPTAMGQVDGPGEVSDGVGESEAGRQGFGQRFRAWKQASLE